MNMRRAESATVEPWRLVRAAEFLRCDLRWLLTGEGGRYVAQQDSYVKPYSKGALEMADIYEAMTPVDQAHFSACANLMQSGIWPEYNAWSTRRGK